MLPAGHGNPFRGREQQGFVQRLQALLKHLYLAVHVSFQRLRLLCRHLQLLKLSQADVDFPECRVHVQHPACGLLLPVRSDKQPLCHANDAVFIGPEFKSFAPVLLLRVHQMPAVELRLAVLRGEPDVLLTALILHPQLVVRRSAQHVAGVVVAGHGVGVFRVVQRIRDVRQVDVAVAVRNRHFGPVGQWRMPAVRFSGIRFRHPQPQVCEALLRIVPVKVHPDAVASLVVQVGVDIVLFPALNAGGQGTVDFRARNFPRAETVPFGVRHAPHRYVQAGITGAPESHQREDGPLFQGINDIALRLQHLTGREE
ncbi:hypothetical protein ENINMM100B1_23130 [Enterobacter intestinihominis]